MPLGFYERHTLVPVSDKQKKSEEDFRFYKKMLRTKIVSSVCFAASVIETEHRLGSTAKLLPQELHSASQHQTVIALK